MRRVSSVSLVLVCVALAGWIAATAAPRDSADVVRQLLENAQRRRAEGTIESRKIALRDLEQARLIAPDNVPVLVALGQVYLESLYLRGARSTFERALKLSPDDADAEFGLGRYWTRVWLERPDSTDMALAMAYMTDATHDRHGFCDAWAALTALDIERGDEAAAFEAATQALAAAPERGEAQLAMACVWYRNGEVERADSLFAIAIPHLSKKLRNGFADITPLLPPDEVDRVADMNPNERDAYADWFWTVNDPDPTTPLNEARLEFRARLAHATLLFGDPWDPHWRARTEAYSRYGHHVQIADDFNSVHHEIPVLAMGEVATRPTPEAMARLGLSPTSNGFAVFNPLPPGSHPIPLAALVARFESDRGGRLLAQVETPGTPADSLTGECVVMDSLAHEVGKTSREMTAGACDPARLRTADFAFDLPPGRYRVTFAVRNARHGRGLTNVWALIPDHERSLAMSDVVLACGTLDPAASKGAVRLNPNIAARVGDDEPLHAYFEVYRLRTDREGGNLFEYEYSVRSTSADKRPWYARLIPGGPPAALQYQTEQEGVGTLRRQYINIPAATLGYGHYRLTIKVRDRQGGGHAERSVEFDKEPAMRGAR